MKKKTKKIPVQGRTPKALRHNPFSDKKALSKDVINSSTKAI